MDEKEILLKLGHKVRFERVKRKLSQEALAALAQIDIHTLSNIERGMNNTGIITLMKLSKAFEIPIYKLLNFTL